MQENITLILSQEKTILLFFSTLFFMLLIGFIYGFVLYFLFRIKKTLIISLVALFLTSTLVLIYTIITLHSSRCVSPYNTQGCFPVPQNALLSEYSLLLIAEFLLNMCAGIAGTILGMVLSLPGMLISGAFFGKSFQKNDMTENKSHEPERFDSYKSSILYNKPKENHPVKDTSQSEFTKTSLFNKSRR